MTGTVVEHLMGLSQAEDDPNRLDLHFIRTLSADESARSQQGSDLLSFVTNQSPLKGLDRANSKWSKACDRLERETVHGEKAHAAQEVEDAFDLWLAAFRGVEFFTQEWISRRGDSTSITPQFKQFTNDEFDANLAYRICCALRNVSQHSGRVINALTYGTSVDPVSGNLTHDVAIEVDLPLIAATSRFLSAARRREFEQVPSTLALHLIVGYATQSCVRLFARLVDLVGEEVERASAMCAAFHREARAVGAHMAVFVDRPDLFATGQGGMSMRPNSTEEVIALEGRISEVVRTINDPVRVGWRDLVADEVGAVEGNALA